MSGHDGNTAGLNHLADMWKHVRDAVIVSDESYAITAWNRGAEQLYGWTAEEVLGRSGVAILETEFPTGDKARALMEIQQRGYYRGEAIQSRKDKARIHVEIDSTVLFDRDGRINGYLTMNRDISDRKRTEAKVAQNERFLTALTEGLPGLIAYWNQDLICEFANPAHLEWWGRTPAQMNGIPMRELLGEDYFQRNEPHIRGVLAGTPQSFERLITKVDGTIVSAWVQYVPDVADGVIRGFSVLIADVTPQKKIEADLQMALALQRAITDHAPYAISTSDAQGVITTWNPASAGMLGYSAAEMIGTRKWIVLEAAIGVVARIESFSTGCPEGTSPAFEFFLARGQPEPLELTFICKDGSQFPALVSVTPIRDSGGETTGHVTMAVDISQRKQMETDLREAKEKAEHASRSKSQFLATMSHEIRTPLHGVLGMTHLLQVSGLSAPQQEMAGTIKRSGELLLNLLNDVLDHAKIEAGKIDIVTTTFSIDLVLREAVEMSRPVAAEKGLRLKLEPGDDPGYAVKADASRVRQVLLNLIHNAMKFTSVGEVTVASSRSGNSLRVAVSDTGIGISESQKSRMFERFSQADASTTRRFGGTGLGLSISLQLVELMGGTMGFESREGVGSTFWMELPISDETAPADGSTGGSTPGAAAAWSRSEPLATDLRILLAEDNVVNQKVAAGILKKLGYEVDIASNGREAVDMVRRRGYRLILMDCQMPEMDGFVATQEIRRWEAAESSRARVGTIDAGADADPSAIPADRSGRSFIVALTASAMTDERERCRAVGMDGFLAKPFDPSELQKLLSGLEPGVTRAPSGS